MASKINQSVNGYVEWKKKNKDVDDDNRAGNSGSEKKDGDKEDVSCAIPGIGFIVCPVFNFLANVADYTYAFLAGNFLEVDQGLVSDDKVDKAWRIVRNIANAGFVIVFLIVIYSQITGMGISNYGIKKILQKLFVTAILVNVSFIICQLAVDLSNILGYSIRDTLSNIGSQVNLQSEFSYSEISSGFKGKLGLAVAFTTIAAAGGIGLYVAFPFLGGAILSALIAGLTIGALLILRKALIVLLVVISPLAFLAMMLPNTEGLFKKWQKMFMGMLLVFPVVGLLFGAGQLASSVLQPDVPGEDIVLDIVAATVAILPLFLVWPVMKKAMAAAGDISGTVQNIGNKLNGAAQNRYKESTLGQRSEYSKQQRARKRRLTQAGAYKGRNIFRRGASGLHGAFNRSWAGGEFGKRSAAAGQAMVQKEEAEAAEQILDYELNGNFEKALSSDNEAVQALAVKRLADKGEYGANMVANYLANGGKVTSQSMADAMTKMKGVHAGVAETGSQALNHFQSGKSGPFELGDKDRNLTPQQQFASNTNNALGNLAPEVLAKQSSEAIQAGWSGNISAADASSMLNEPQLRKTMSGNTAEALEAIAAGRDPGPPAFNRPNQGNNNQPNPNQPNPNQGNNQGNNGNQGNQGNQGGNQGNQGGGNDTSGWFGRGS